MKFLYYPEHENDEYADVKTYILRNLKLKQYPIFIHIDSEIWLEEIQFPLIEGIDNSSKILGKVTTSRTIELPYHWLGAVDNISNGLIYFVLIPSTYPKKWYSVYIRHIHGYKI